MQEREWFMVVGSQIFRNPSRERVRMRGAPSTAKVDMEITAQR
jgi:hypothetical protein